METEKYLEHHGVIGMKWGVRKKERANKMYTKASNLISKEGSKYNATKHVKTSANGKHFLNGVGTAAALAGSFALLPVSPFASAAVAVTAASGSAITKSLINKHADETISYIQENDSHTINGVKTALEKH